MNITQEQYDIEKMYLKTKTVEKKEVSLDKKKTLSDIKIPHPTYSAL